MTHEAITPAPPETPETAPLAPRTIKPETVRLVRRSKSPHTLAAYRSALSAFDRWIVGQERAADDAAVADYLGHLAETGRAPATASMAVSALRRRAKTADGPDPVGRLASAALEGYRRAHAARGRGQAAPLTADAVAAILATAKRPRPTKRGQRGTETAETANRRGTVDAALAALLFQAGLRRSEACALTWADITDASDGNGILVTVRQSKTNQTGSTADRRYAKNGCARAIRELRTLREAEASAAGRAAPAPEDQLLDLSPSQAGRRIAAAARAAGIEGRITGHSGRIGLATELVTRGASTADTMLAGGWKTSRMVARYAAGATAERGAVARYL